MVHGILDIFVTLINCSPHIGNDLDTIIESIASDYKTFKTKKPTINILSKFLYLNIWRSSSLSELTPHQTKPELTHLNSEASIQ